MAVEYKTCTFTDSTSGRSAMDKTIKEMAQSGWKIHSKETSQQGYKGGKTCCLGCLFLPLALLGKKKGVITVIFEREATS